MELNWEKACLGYYRGKKEIAEKFIKNFDIVCWKFSTDEYDYIVDLVKGDIKESEKQIKYYKQQLEEEE